MKLKENTIKKIQSEINKLNANLEKSKTETAKMKVHLLRVETAILINIALDQKRNTLQIKNIIDADVWQMMKNNKLITTAATTTATKMTTHKTTTRTTTTTASHHVFVSVNSVTNSQPQCFQRPRASEIFFIQLNSIASELQTTAYRSSPQLLQGK